jgi:hypothetical protein
MKKKLIQIAGIILIAVLGLFAIGLGYVRLTRGWDDAARDLAWSVGVDRKMKGDNDRSSLAFHYKQADTKFLQSIHPPPGFVVDPSTNGRTFFAWNGRWEGFECSLTVFIEPGLYAVGTDC